MVDFRRIWCQPAGDHRTVVSGLLRRPTEKVLYGSVSLLKKVKLISEQAASKAKERIQKELMEFYEGFAQIRQDIGEF